MVQSKGVQKSEAPAKPNLLRQIHDEHRKELIDLAKDLLSNTGFVVDVKIIPRRIYLKPADFGKHGYSDGCPRCIYFRTGVGLYRTRPHTEECRARIEAELIQTLEGKVRKEREMVRKEAELFAKHGYTGGCPKCIVNAEY